MKQREANAAVPALVKRSMMPNRVVVTAKDIMNITGKSNRSAQRLLREIRRVHGKDRMAMVTLMEFCDHTALSAETVERYLT